MRMVNSMLKAALWPDHPLGHPTAGLESTIRGASRESLMDFMTRHYGADRLILACAGNVDHEDFAAQVRDNFWSLGRNGGAAPPPAPDYRLGRVVARPRDLRQVCFALAWPAPPYTSPERYTWHVFTSLFGSGPTSRLYRSLREEKGMVYHVAAQYQAYGSAGALIVEGATTPQTLIPVLAGILIELLRMCQEAIDPEDHHRTVQSLVSQHLVSGDSAYVRMSRLALQELYFRRAVPSDEVIAGLRSQSAEGVQQAAIAAFSAGLPTIALTGPITEDLLQAVGGMLADFGGQPTLELVSEEAPVSHPA
jgi:predicted Zn-dependent peptidase